MNEQTLDFELATAMLSPMGRQRREEMLVSLQRMRAGRRVRRALVRTSVAIAAVAVAVVLGLWRPAVVVAPVPEVAQYVAEVPACVIRLVGGEPSQVRIITDDGPRLIRVLTDDELLAALREAGRPDGIAIVGGRFMLASRIGS